MARCCWYVLSGLGGTSTDTCTGAALCGTGCLSRASVTLGTRTATITARTTTKRFGRILAARRLALKRYRKGCTRTVCVRLSAQACSHGLASPDTCMGRAAVLQCCPCIVAVDHTNSAWILDIPISAPATPHSGTSGPTLSWTGVAPGGGAAQIHITPRLALRAALAHRLSVGVIFRSLLCLAEQLDHTQMTR